MSNNKNPESVWVVIPAAGTGQRMQSEIPKQYLKINHKTIIEHTFECFLENDSISGIVVALDADDSYWKQIDIGKYTLPVYTVEGGNERSDSVLQALEYLLMVEKLPESQWVMVHDAARPCLPTEDLDALLAIRDQAVIGGILASPVRDTMKRSSPGQAVIEKTESRDNLWHALTPQLFKLGELRNAIKNGQEKAVDITDEASAMEAVGEKPVLVHGSHLNIKITYPEDIKIAETLLNEDAVK